MPEPNYQDFDVAIEQLGGGRYRVRVIDSPSGQARSDFILPFSDLELENFMLRVGRPRSGVRRLESPEAEAARAFGRKLFESVFTGDVATAWQRSLDMAEQGDRGLRLRIRLGDAPHLAELPWEYLYLPSGERHMVLSAWTPLVRYLDLPWGAEPLTVQPPLRMLAMVSDPSDVAALDVDQEWAKVDDSLGELEEAGLLEVTRLDKATLRELQRALRRTDYHIFHFIGHGGFDQAAGDGVLVLENDSGQSRKVTGRELGTILHDSRTIRLAVLNSCEGARSGTSDPFGGAAQSLAVAGVPAVIAMQFEITDQAAIVFAHELYAAIADGFAVEAALAEARRAIFGSGNDVEWGTPVLYLRADNGKLFDVAGPVTPPPPREEQDEDEDVEPEPVPIPDDHMPDVVPIITPEPVAPVTSAPEPAHPDEAETPVLVSRESEERDALEELPDIVQASMPPPSRPRPKRMWAIVTAALVVGLGGWWLSSLGGDSDDPGYPREFVDSSTVAAVPAPENIEIDGSFDDWASVPTAYQMRFAIHNDESGGRLGTNSEGHVRVAYDDAGLYLAIGVDDDIYSQMNTGDQVWRGDAVNINVSSVPPGEASDNPDADDFQLTMTVADADGRPAHAWFQGTGADSFQTAETTKPVTIVSDPPVPDGGYRMEAFIPWGVFEMNGPPSTEMVALFTVFDNDGEVGPDGPVQRTILANRAQAQFQNPQTWGTLRFETTPEVSSTTHGNGEQPLLFPDNGHFYEAVAVPGGINWPDARAAAESRLHEGVRGHLATLTSAEEASFVETNFPQAFQHGPLPLTDECRRSTSSQNTCDLPYWLGGFQSAGNTPDEGWQWVTGEPFEYERWAPGEPNDHLGRQEDCLRTLRAPSPDWNDSECEDQRPGGYVVEYSP